MRNMGMPKAPRGDGSRDYVQSLKSQYPGAIITQSYLRSEIQLGTTATSQFAFNILANQGTPGTTERRLQITDRFAVTALSVMSYNVLVAAASQTIAKSQAKLFSWNNPAQFTAANALVMESVYNGYLRMVIDGTTYIDSLDARRFYRVPTSQQGVAVSAFTPDTASKFGAIQADGWDGTHYNFAQMTPAVVLNGAGRNEVTLNTPEATVVSPASTTTNFLVLYMRGWLIQNSSTLNR
jgi:hypothetical protein